MKVYACIMLLSLVLTACGVSRQEQNIREHSVPNGPAAHPVEDVARLPQEANATEQADHLAKIARRVNGVANANCVVLGNTAIVGIDVDGKLERADVGTIKYSVAEAIHKDPDGLNSLSRLTPILPSAYQKWLQISGRDIPFRDLAWSWLILWDA